MLQGEATRYKLSRSPGSQLSKEATTKDEWVQKISQKTGLSPDKAQEVLNVLMSHLKEKLPEPLANGLNSYLSGGSAEGGSLADKAMAMASGLGSMFGKKTE